ncbi:MAG: helix-turn-helix transcriptional regulator [Oscillospiraceae bacterium]|nr:helix-turn-helix transcriptional regulator [Oscillospiraceae bacterium]
MPREKFQALTEQMFYILLCLKDECCGMDIMTRVEQLTCGRVRVGPGTLYNLLEQFAEADFIRQTKVEGRRRSYILTDRGRRVLRDEYQRVRVLARDYERMMGEEEPK